MADKISWNRLLPERLADLGSNLIVAEISVGIQPNWCHDFGAYLELTAVLRIGLDRPRLPSK
jgi:hypothetical protein